MPLTYQVTRQIIEEHVLEVFEDWGMFSEEGDAEISLIAQRAYDQVESLENPSRAQVRTILIKMVSRWRKLRIQADFGEASDTAVREAVAEFTEKLALASKKFYDYELNLLWQEVYEEAKRNS